jgi:hypothetical protein
VTFLFGVGVGLVAGLVILSLCVAASRADDDMGL